ncbi:MAG: hypothetical protein HC842_10005, partial [Cytophagales bacterium]|nr:hypothetical protein [Cytophagales bacterium]
DTIRIESIKKSFEVLLSGRIGSRELSLVNKHLGQLPALNPEPSPRLVAWTSTGPYHYDERPESLQTSIRLGKPHSGKKAS